MDGARVIVMMVFVALLAACGNGNEGKVQEHVWQGQVNALEKAKGVDEMVKDAAEQQRQKVEQATGALQQR